MIANTFLLCEIKKLPQKFKERIMDYKEFKKNITHMLQKNIYEEYTIETC